MNPEDEQGWTYALTIPKKDTLAYLVETHTKEFPQDEIKIRLGDQTYDGLPAELIPIIRTYQGPGPFELYSVKENK